MEADRRTSLTPQNRSWKTEAVASEHTWELKEQIIRGVKKDKFAFQNQIKLLESSELSTPWLNWGGVGAQVCGMGLHLKAESEEECWL